VHCLRRLRCAIESTTNHRFERRICNAANLKVGGAFVFCCCGGRWSSGLSACMSLDGTPCAVARIDKKENKTRVPRRHQRRSLCLTPPRAPLSAAFRSAWVQTLVPQSQLQAQ
jgi:hypothetical protein